MTWPAGFPRDQRSLQLSRRVIEDHDGLVLAIQGLFELTPVPARLFLLLVQHEQVPHEESTSITSRSGYMSARCGKNCAQAWHQDPDLVGVWLSAFG